MKTIENDIPLKKEYYYYSDDNHRAESNRIYDILSRIRSGGCGEKIYEFIQPILKSKHSPTVRRIIKLFDELIHKPIKNKSRYDKLPLGSNTPCFYIFLYEMLFENFYTSNVLYERYQCTPLYRHFNRSLLTYIYSSELRRVVHYLSYIINLGKIEFVLYKQLCRKLDHNNPNIRYIYDPKLEDEEIQYLDYLFELVLEEVEWLDWNVTNEKNKKIQKGKMTKPYRTRNNKY